MELDKKDKKLVEEAITEWEQKNLLTNDHANELRATLKPKKSGGQIAQYFFIIAIASTLLAFGAIFIDDKLLERIKDYFDVGNITIAISCTLISIIWFTYLFRKRGVFSNMIYEVYMVLGGLIALSALTYYCKDIGFGNNYSGFLISGSGMFLILSSIFRSYALWIATVLALMGWYGSFTYWFNDADNLFLGMNYPIRFTLFGLILTAFSFIQQKISVLRYSYRQTYTLGLLVLFTGLWGASIFGNYGHYAEWEKVRQVQVIGYAGVMAVCSVIALLLGIKYDDEVTRDVGIISILLNLYSRYFEFFWDHTNKGLFFLVLAVSFGVLGWWIDKRIKKKRTAIGDTVH